MKLSQAEALSLALSTMQETKGVVGYKIARNMRMIEDELIDYYQKKQELFTKYGREEDGQWKIDIGTENYKKYMDEFLPVMNQDVSFDFRKITEDELIDSGLTAKQMALIWDLVE